MGLNETVSAERLHIGFFGVRNAGKSSLVNAVTGQELSVVSEVKGTTTDPVKKSMELLPLGPVLIIDTPGLDDEGELGAQRVRKARQILAQTDIAVLVVDAVRGRTEADEELIALFEEKKLPYLIAYNKADLLPGTGTAENGSAPQTAAQASGGPFGHRTGDAIPLTGASAQPARPALKNNEIYVSAATRQGVRS